MCSAYVASNDDEHYGCECPDAEKQPRLFTGKLKTFLNGCDAANEVACEAITANEGQSNKHHKHFDVHERLQKSRLAALDATATGLHNDSVVFLRES